MILLGVWLLAVGLPFALVPQATSHIADRIRRQGPNAVSDRQVAYARRAGITIALLGVCVIVGVEAHLYIR